MNAPDGAVKLDCPGEICTPNVTLSAWSTLVSAMTFGVEFSFHTLSCRAALATARLCKVHGALEVWASGTPLTGDIAKEEQGGAHYITSRTSLETGRLA
mmetsp:Transcript_27728/g.70710  ORF Transcript_27728/g.70710 Transcript_27728/m.70710 type:complete len:99 (-) Transcript_27728:429-725(-)